MIPISEITCPNCGAVLSIEVKTEPQREVCERCNKEIHIEWFIKYKAVLVKEEK